MEDKKPFWKRDIGLAGVFVLLLAVPIVFSVMSPDTFSIKSFFDHIVTLGTFWGWAVLIIGTPFFLLGLVYYLFFRLPVKVASKMDGVSTRRDIESNPHDTKNSLKMILLEIIFVCFSVYTFDVIFESVFGGFDSGKPSVFMSPEIFIVSAIWMIMLHFVLKKNRI